MGNGSSSIIQATHVSVRHAVGIHSSWEMPAAHGSGIEDGTTHTYTFNIKPKHAENSVMKIHVEERTLLIWPVSDYKITSEP